MRILVTGSRDWDDDDLIWDTLMEYHRKEENPILVSGACPTGADAIAEEIAAVFEWEIERHPADWKNYGKAAGFVRNKEMVDLGADVCLAFIKNHSKGATMTAGLAMDASMPVEIFRA